MLGLTPYGSPEAGGTPASCRSRCAKPTAHPRPFGPHGRPQPAQESRWVLFGMSGWSCVLAVSVAHIWPLNADMLTWISVGWLM